MELFTRLLDRDRQIQEEERSLVTRTSVRAFDIVPSEFLLGDGFIATDERDTLYFGPDADVFLSDAFGETHCFYSLMEDESKRAGLGFEPMNPDVSDIAGVLWLDQETAVLREAFFRYTGPIAEAVDRPHEGQISFQQLPDGGWIIGAWHIRVPIYTRTLEWAGRGMPVARDGANCVSPGIESGEES